jgi:exopolyphosphatase/pppGpp-phosphohydrolase
LQLVERLDGGIAHPFGVLLVQLVAADQAVGGAIPGITVVIVAEQAVDEPFTQLQPAWRLSKRYGRPILRYAALLHEIGLCIEYKKAPQHAAYIIDNIDMPGFTPAQKKLLSALLFNQRDEFKLEPLEKQGAVTGRQAIRLARILRISLILCMRRTQGTVPRFMLQADEDALTLTLQEELSEPFAQK